MGILRVENSCEDCNYERVEEALYRRKTKTEAGSRLPLGAADATVTNQPIISNNYLQTSCYEKSIHFALYKV